jgi:hypothetical protein
MSSYFPDRSNSTQMNTVVVETQKKRRSILLS